MTIEQWLKETHPDHDITLIGVSPRELQKLLNENEEMKMRLKTFASMTAARFDRALTPDEIEYLSSVALKSGSFIQC